MNVFSQKLKLTRHAWKRMCGRSLSPDMVGRVLGHGRATHIRGATIYAVGRKEVERFKQKGIDLSDVAGVQVVCDRHSQTVLTAYRNHSFRSLRPRARRPHRLRPAHKRRES